MKIGEVLAMAEDVFRATGARFRSSIIVLSTIVP